MSEEYINALENLHDRILNDAVLLAKVDLNELLALFHAHRVLERQKAEIDILIRKHDSLQDEIAELQCKNSELEIELKAMQGDRKIKTYFEVIDNLERAVKLAEYVCSDYCDDIRVSTIKDTIEFIKQLHEDNDKLFRSFEAIGGAVMVEKIKELTEQRKGD